MSGMFQLSLSCYRGIVARTYTLSKDPSFNLAYFLKSNFNFTQYGFCLRFFVRCRSMPIYRLDKRTVAFFF